MPKTTKWRIDPVRTTLALMVVIGALTGGVSLLLVLGNGAPRSPHEGQQRVKAVQQPSRRPVPFGCTGTGTVMFSSPPRRLADIALVEPIGLMIGGHVTPIDHGYFYPPGWEDRDVPRLFRDVLSPADGIVSDISLVGGRRGDYRLVIHHTCTFYTIYIHLKELSPRIRQQAGDVDANRHDRTLAIPVQAGEVIGRANAFDFSVHDDRVTLPGFIVPEHYENESWKIHTVDMFAHFVPSVRDQLLAKNVRGREPRAGKIDYDIDGKLVGNWFQEGSNGYAGLTNKQGSYWKTHLAFAYDGLDPSLVVVSLGNFAGEAKQFAVKGNAPNPARVDTASGLTKYELVDIDYTSTLTGQRWDRRSYVAGVRASGGAAVRGTVLVQMLSPRRIKFEAFPGQAVERVAGFTNNARIYER